MNRLFYCLCSTFRVGSRFKIRATRPGSHHPDYLIQSEDLLRVTVFQSPPFFGQTEGLRVSAKETFLLSAQ